MGRDFMAQLPSLVFGVLVFTAFLFAARGVWALVERVTLHRQQSASLKILLSRVVYVLMLILGILVTAIDYYRSLNPEDSLVAGGYTTLRKLYRYEPVPAVLTAAQARYVLGVQANVWTEYMPTARKLEYSALLRHQLRAHGAPPVFHRVPVQAAGHLPGLAHAGGPPGHARVLAPAPLARGAGSAVRGQRGADAALRPGRGRTGHHHCRAAVFATLEELSFQTA